MLDQVDDLDAQFHASPPVRQYHYRANANDPNLRKFEVQLVPIPEQNISLKRLLLLVGAICNNADRDCFTMHVLMDKFERLIQTDA